MPGNPFTEARQQQLTDDATEVLQSFSKEYLKMFGLALFNKIKNEIEPNDDPRRLTYREWDSVQRTELFSGQCFMKTGEGPGSFGKWKAVFVVETLDYNLDIYKDEKSYQAGKKATKTIRVAGYSLERDPSHHYRWDMRYLARGLGLTEAEVELMTSYSPYSWALAHPQRTNYIFQLHKSKEPLCPCMGANVVEPGEVGSEFAQDRDRFLGAFGRCVAKASPRDTDVPLGSAFDMTCVKMSSQLSNLYGWSDNGTEEQMLTDMLIAQCLPAIRDGMLEDLAGPVSMKLALWYKTQGLIAGVLSPMVTAGWGAMQTGAKEVEKKAEPVIRAGVGPILQAKVAAKDKVREAVVSKLGEFLQKNVTPFIKPIFDCLDKPMTAAFQRTHDCYEQKVEMSALPTEAVPRNQVLDALPRTWNNVSDMRAATYDLVAPLGTLKSLSSDIFGSIDTYDLRSQAEDTLLQTLDAAVYTLELRIEEQGANESLKAEVLKDFEHDIVVQRARFTRGLVKGLLISNFMRACVPLTDVLAQFDDQIPADFHDFISIAAIFDEIVDLFVGEPIESMVDGAYPLPK